MSFSFLRLTPQSLRLSRRALSTASFLGGEQAAESEAQNAAARSLSTPGEQRREALRLYRHVVRTAYQLPDRGARIYYLNHARGHFVQHADERDVERVSALIERGYADTAYIRKKYKLGSK